MKITIKTAHGYLSAQPPTPGGLARWQYREAAGPWETFELDGFEFPVMPPPVDSPPVELPALDRGFNVPANAAVLMQTTAGRRAFIIHGLLLAYHEAPEERVVYALDKADELIERGQELGIGLQYFWERLIGRGSGPPYVAIDGPYKGLANYEGSLTEGL